ncbi:MAG: hypothetical protein ABSG59_13125 [Verrucomicrobiota bacterium]|jgi:hypothetical protein
MINLQNLSVGQLRKVVAIKERIERLEAKMEAVTGDSTAAPAPGRKRRRMSPAARARIAAAQRARWAKARGGSVTAPAKRPRKRRVSAATRAKLAAVAKARWARVRATGKSTL